MSHLTVPNTAQSCLMRPEHCTGRDWESLSLHEGLYPPVVQHHSLYFFIFFFVCLNMGNAVAAQLAMHRTLMLSGADLILAAIPAKNIFTWFSALPLGM